MKIGLFFGSFNPVHIGHLVIANHILHTTSLQEIWLVVSPQNPFKKQENLLDEYQRLHMVNLAIENVPGLRASDIEFKMPKPSYTAHTLIWLKEKYPEKEFSLIMGEDNLKTLHKWKNVEELIKHNIIVYPRREGGVSVTENKHLTHTQIEICNAPVMEVSSSYVRHIIKSGIPPRYCLPEKVFQYVDEMGFYR